MKNIMAGLLVAACTCAQDTGITQKQWDHLAELAARETDHQLAEKLKQLGVAVAPLTADEVYDILEPRIERLEQSQDKKERK